MSVEKNEYPIDPLALERLKICESCSFFQSDEQRCKMCGCLVKSMVNEELKTCPVGKW